MKTESTNKYFAFISYKREDEEWAIWLQHELEYYHLPALLNGREDLPKVFRPVFRDIDELKAGNLPEQIHEALASSSHLIVICSPRSAKSEWVNKEIETFIEIGKEKGINNLEHVFPFIVEGKPHAEDKVQECFPKALRDLPADKERIGGNVNESGRDKAFIKVMAGMLPNVGMDMLWNRYERDKAEEERKKREERDRLLIMQSRFISEKANELINHNSYLARLLALEVLPKDLSNPERPLTSEAEKALRTAHIHQTAILQGHTAHVRFASFSPDGKTIASASSDYSIRIWNANSGEAITVLKGHNFTVQSVCFSTDGKQLVSASWDDTIRIWDIKTRKTIKTIQGHTNRITYSNFSPDGRYIISASRDGSIRIWDAKTGKEKSKIDGHISAVNSAQFSPDGKQIVSASDDKTICIWDVLTGKKLHCLSGHTKEVNYATYSPDGRHIASASNDNTIRIWNAKLELELRCLNGHCKSVKSVNYSPNGKYIVSASADQTIRIWDEETGKELHSMTGHSLGVSYANYSPDGKRIVSTGDYTVHLWDAVSDIPQRLGNSIHSIVFSPDGLHILIASKDNSICILDAKSLKMESIILKHSRSVNCAAYSPDGKQIVSASDDHTVRVWDTESKKELLSLTIYGNITSAAFSPDGKQIIASDDIKNVRIWNAQTGELTHSLSGHFYGVNSCAYSPDGKCAITGGMDFKICFWDTQTGQLQSFIYYDPSLAVPKSLSYSTDGKLIVAAMDDGSIRIIDAEKQAELKSLKGHTSYVNSASFSPSGKYIVSASSDKTVRIWDVKTGIELQTFIGHTSPVNTVRFSPDEKRIYSASDDGAIKIWDFPPLQELIDQTRERFKNRPLTPEERRMYYLE